MSADESIVSALSLKQRVARDITPCADVPRLFTIMGLVPASDEVSELEHTRSHERVNRLLPIIGNVNLLATMGGEVCVKAMLDGSDLDPALQQRFAGLVMKAALATSQAVVANLLDLGLLKEGWTSE